MNIFENKEYCIMKLSENKIVLKTTLDIYYQAKFIASEYYKIKYSKKNNYGQYRPYKMDAKQKQISKKYGIKLKNITIKFYGNPHIGYGFLGYEIAHIPKYINFLSDSDNLSEENWYSRYKAVKRNEKLKKLFNE